MWEVLFGTVSICVVFAIQCCANRMRDATTVVDYGPRDNHARGLHIHRGSFDGRIFQTQTGKRCVFVAEMSQVLTQFF